MTTIKTPTDAELLPCPFCGKTHTLIVGAASEAWDADENGPYPHTETYAIFCDASTDGGKGGCGGSGGYFVTKEDAIDAWNHRAAPAGEPVAWRYRMAGDLQWQYTERQEQTTHADEVQRVAVYAPSAQPVEPPRVPLTDAQIEKLREQTFSTNNPFCPCDSKTMRKAVRAAEATHGIKHKEGGQDG